MAKDDAALGAAAGDGKKKDLNVIWFFLAATVVGIIFFSFSTWLRTPKEKIVHCRSHLCPKAAPVIKAERQVRGYKVAY